MKSEKNILIAFLLNLFFSIFEFFGGIFTGSMAILSDALHDIGDAASIGVSYLLEKKSKKAPDEKYTYGYARFSSLGGLITTTVLLAGSCIVIYSAILRIINPVKINYDGMLAFAIIGVMVNFLAAFFTKDGCSLNQKAVNLHMLEDVFGWAVVLIGAVIMRFTNLTFIDPLMSIGVSVFIILGASKTLKKILSLFLIKTPISINISNIKEHIRDINGVIDIHHIHVWSIDESIICATMHIVATSPSELLKREIREELLKHGVSHSTLELEAENEVCCDKECTVRYSTPKHSHHHH